MSDDYAVVFVYGTLRPGQPNHSLIARDVQAAVSAHGHGLRLYAAAHHGYPYATTGRPGDCVVGALLTFRPDREGAAIGRLDYLEGFDADGPDRGHYVRRRRTFVADQPSRVGPTGTPVDAWIYLAGPTTSPAGLSSISTGDWLHPAWTAERTCSCVACSV